jgi:ubiquinone/menaquinone biosynthesis C-methylase UbiE
LLPVFLIACTGLKRWAYEGFGRDRWQKPAEVMRALEIRAGQEVADVGAGSGYFTFRLAQAVGPSGKVYAVDIDEDMIDYLKKRAGEEGAHHVIPTAARPEDPQLPETSIDWIFVCNTYHHIEKRTAYFKNAKRYLKPGGRVAIIDFNGKGWPERWFIPIVPKDAIRMEMEAAGYHLQKDFNFLPRQNFLVFSQIPN